MAIKNVVLCSDGTGNKGGYTPDSNVFRMYNALDYSCPDQVSFYDNGVGTATNKYLRAITGAFGFGFNDNVIDLYEFLVRHYNPGDKIFLFGFSRGAATVRAFAGMLQTVGLLDRNKPNCAGEEQLDAMLKRVRRVYMTHPKAGEEDPAWEKDVEKLRADCMVHVEGDWRIPITFLGVWDTVSALGFPQDWSKTVDWIFSSLDFLSDKVFHQHAYEYQLDNKIECACHALALDDERKTFHPHVFWEVKDPRQRYDDTARPTHLHQVWFAGVHSNVGGGYERAGMASVTLHWMMCWALRYGLKLDSDALADAEAASNVTDKLYDSRDGAAAYYRYAPRQIEALWGERFDGPVKIHASVHERIKQGAARYAPGYLPYKINLVRTPCSEVPKGDKGDPAPQGDADALQDVRYTAPSKDVWERNRKEIDRQVNRRAVNYRAFVETTLAWVVLALILAVFPSAPPYPMPDGGSAGPVGWIISGLLRIADFLLPIVPGFLEPFIEYAFITRPVVGGIFLLWIVFFIVSGRRTRESDLAAREQARLAYLAVPEAGPADAQQADEGADTRPDPGKPPSKKLTNAVKWATLPIWIAVIIAGGHSFLTYKVPPRGCGEYLGHPTRSLAGAGATTTAMLESWKPVTTSGLILQQGVTYRVNFSVPKGGFNRIPPEGLEKVPAGAAPRVTAEYLDTIKQANTDHWFDASIVADPGKGWWPTPKDGLVLYGFTQAVTGFSKWGLLRHPGENLSIPVAIIRGPCRDGRICAFQIPIRAEGTTFTSLGDGEFCAYANDLPLMASNNKGRLELTVTRLP